MIDIDGWITIGTKLDTQKFDQEVSNVESKIESTEKKQEIINQKTEKYQAELKKASDEVDRLAQEFEKAAQKADSLRATINATKAGSFQNFQATSDYEAQVKIVDELAAKLDKAESKQSDLSAKVTQSKLQYENSAKAVDKLRGKLQQINVKRQQQEFKAIEKSTNEVQKTIGNSIKKIGKMALAVFSVRSAYNALSRASSTLAQYNEQYATDLEYMRFALAQGLAPILEKIVTLAQTLMYYINYLSQAWFGVNLFSNASAKSFQDMSKSASKTAKSTKEMKNNLASFDELNVLSQNNEIEAGGVGSVAPSFDLGNMEDIEIPEWLVFIKNNGEEIISVVLGIAGAIQALKIADFLNDLGLIPGKLSAIKAVGIGIAIYGVISTIKELIKYIKDPSFENFGNVLKGIGIIILGVGIAIASVPAMIAGAIVLAVGLIIKYWEDIKTFLQNGIDWLRGAGDAVEESFGKSIRKIYDSFIDILQVMLDTFDSAITTIKGVFDGLITFFTGVFTGDWGKAWEGIKEIFSSVWEGIKESLRGTINVIISLINGMIGALELALNWIVDKINAIEIVNPFNGEEIWSPNIPRFDFGTIPMLARGGIINKPTHVIAGEAGKEAVLPLENNTEWMDILADKIAGNIGLGGGNITINFTGSMAQLVRMLKPQIDRENSRVGARIITGGAY